jgi:branched-chain amino acid transport system permease protein
MNPDIRKKKRLDEEPFNDWRGERLTSSGLFKLTSYSVVLLVLALLPFIFNSVYLMHVLILIFIYIMAAMSFRTITLSGQFPLAHGAFMGIGAYISGISSRWLGVPPFIAIPMAAILTAGTGIFLGFLFVRLRSLYYAMGSLFFGIGILQVIYALGKWSGGYSGLVGIKPLFAGPKITYYYFFLFLTVLCGIALYRFEYSRIGINLKAIAQSYLAAGSVGINEGFYRILTVGVGCFFVGLAGAGYAHYNLVLSGSSFNFMATLWLVMYLLIGGIEKFSGPIIGTFILILIPELFRDMKIYTPFISAGLLGIVVYLMPKGVSHLLANSIDRAWISLTKKNGRGND